MSYTQIDYNDIKRKLRRLKRLEIKIRFGNSEYKEDIKTLENNIKADVLVWNEFFELKGVKQLKAKYSIEELGLMSREEFKNVVDEFFYNVYYKFYRENGMNNIELYNPDILDQFGLPYDANFEDVRKRFKELAKKYHPDAGGNEESFIELMEGYERLINDE